MVWTHFTGFIFSSLWNFPKPNSKRGTIPLCIHGKEGNLEGNEWFFYETLRKTPAASEKERVMLAVQAQTALSICWAAKLRYVKTNQNKTNNQN